MSKLKGTRILAIKLFSRYICLAIFASILFAQGILFAAVPARQPGNPDYLIRVAYLIPTDRQLDYVVSPMCPGSACVNYTSKVDDAVARIRTVMETLNDFYAWEMVNHLVPPTGQPMNLERDGLGRVHVNVINGTLPTQGVGGYWGDATGLNGGNIYGPAISDVLGNATAVLAETEKTIWLIFADTFVFDTGTNPATLRGYLGLGTNQNSNSQGWGGTGVVAAGVLSFFPPDPGTPATRQVLLQDYLCSSTLAISIDGQVGSWRERRPVNSVVTNLMLGELTSTYLGVIGHEFLHAVGAGHGGLSGFSDLMGGGYNRMGQAVRTMYGFASCPSVPLASAPFHLETRLGEPFSNLAARSPYFNVTVDADKSDPDFNWAYPPRGSYLPVSTAAPWPAYNFRIQGADNVGGAGLSGAYLYGNDGYLYDFDYFPTVNPLAYDVPWSNPFIGRRDLSVLVNDLAGNVRFFQHPTFGMVFQSPYTSGIYQRTVFVRPPGDPRDGLASLGSYLNAYSNIQTAVNAANALGGGTVLIMNGTYPLSASISLPNYVSVVGESVGGVLLDGQGGAFNIFSDSAPGHRFGNILSNLAFANAQAIYSGPSSYGTWDVTLSNCVAYNLSGIAFTIPLRMDKNVMLVQNTIVNCGGGFDLDGFYPEFPLAIGTGFLLQNNIVVGCSGTGIRLDNVKPVYTSGRSGFNLSQGNGTDFAGNGDGVIAGGYASTRLTGEISMTPQFEGTIPYTSPLELKLEPGSRGTHEGDPWTENADTQRRDMGAFINTADSVNAVRTWSVFE